MLASSKSSMAEATVDRRREDRRRRSRPRAREGRAALMPYMMGGFPDARPRWRWPTPTREAGADLVELGVPFSDPLADGPVIHAAGDPGAGRAGRRSRACSRSASASPGRVPVRADGLREHGARAGRRASSPRMLARRRRRGRDRPRPAARTRRTRSARRCATPASRWCRSSRRRRRRAPRAASASGPGLRLRRLRHPGDRRAGRRSRRASPSSSRPCARSRTVPVAVGFGIGTPEQAAAVGRIADGVIVGTRLVRAVARRTARRHRPPP